MVHLFLVINTGIVACTAICYVTVPLVTGPWVCGHTVLNHLPGSNCPVPSDARIPAD